MWKDLSDSEKTRWTAENDEYECRSIDDGVARYKRAMEHIDVTPVERRKILERYSTLAKAIEEDQKAILGGLALPGRPQTWAPAYLTLDAEKLAVITLRSVIRVVLQDGSGSKLTSMAINLASSVKLQHELEEVVRINKQRSKEEKGFSRNFLNKLQMDGDKVKKLYKRMNDGPLKWSQTQSIGLGSRLLKILCDCKIGWEMALVREKKRTIYYVNISDKLLEEMSKASEEGATLAAPLYRPMTCPPRDWVQDGSSITGGFRLITLYPIKYSGASSQHKPDLSKHDMTNVLKAVNAIQAVEWEIDTETLALARRFMNGNNPQWDHLIPATRERPRPAVLPEGHSRAELKIWRQKRDEEFDKFRSVATQRIKVARALASAGSLINAPVFFVHALDWRGRIYPCPSPISPQGSDLEKALLRFKEKVALGTQGLNRLKIWAAGCAGMNKVSFEDRIKWWDSTWGNKPDVDNDMRWTEYDDPFLFVQAAREIGRAIASGAPARYMSSVSVCVDGSQNGLQHLSAMGRDKVGGMAVNLVDAVVPSDLYANVATLVYKAILEDCEALIKTGNVTDDCGEPLPPLAWVDELEEPKVRRKAVKRSVLAYPYGVTKAGMRDGLLMDGLTNGVPGSKHKNAWYLAEKIDLSVRDVVISAAKLMDWFRMVAEEMGKAGRAIEWVTPAGMPCRMRYLIQEDRRIDVNGMSLTIKQDTEIIATAHQVRGVVANIVHSLDASHLVSTCHRMVAQGFHSFQFIHDSYGCHAGRIGFLDAALRQEFVRLHTDDLIKPFHDQVTECGIVVPPPPALGDLDIESVRTSSFFFA